MRIDEMVDQQTLLLGLAEEAAELSQAALKLYRARDGKNPTAVTEENAVRHLNEEIGDCRLYLDQLHCVNEDMIDKARKRKLARWAARLLSKEMGLM